MNRMKSPYFCANGCISEYDNGSCTHFLSSSSESSIDDVERKILVDVTVENDTDVGIPSTSKTVRNRSDTPEFCDDSPFSCSNE